MRKWSRVVKGRTTYSSPGVRGTSTALLLDLEPDRLILGHERSAVVVVTLGHVYDLGSQHEHCVAVVNNIKKTYR